MERKNRYQPSENDFKCERVLWWCFFQPPSAAALWSRLLIRVFVRNDIIHIVHDAINLWSQVLGTRFDQKFI